MKTNTDYDVIISGAGPVGLFLACELALAKCSVLILERAESPNHPLKQLPFGIRGLSTPTIEALQRRGLLKELEIHKRLKSPHANAVQGPRRQVGHFAGIPFHEGDVDMAQWKYHLPGSTAPVIISEMLELETVLTRRAQELGVVIERGCPTTGFSQTARGTAIHETASRIIDKVTVQAGGKTFHARYLVGCDGSRSIVRKLGGFEFAGTEPFFTGYSAKVDIADPEKLKPGRNLTASGMYLQSQPGYIIIQDFDGGAFHTSGKPLTREHVQATLRRISDTDVTITTLHFATTWTDRARQATTYRNGRILLAGDAAHIHSPLGGQGLNLGIGDAMNLGWKLAAVIRRQASEELLDSYYTERHPIGEQVLDWSRAQVALMMPDPGARALNAIVRDLIGTSDGATYIASRVWGILMHYDLGDGHPLTGYSIPNFETTGGKFINDLMHDGHGILIDFSPNKPLASLAKTYEGRITYITGKAKNEMDITAALVRPDGFIAYASEAAPDPSQFAKAASRWFGSAGIKDY